MLVTDADVLGLDEVGEPFELVRLSELPLSPAELRTMTIIYDEVEFATAVKPSLLRLLIDRGADVAVYLDPDVEIFASLDELVPVAEKDHVVLIPHILAPIPQDGLRPTAKDIAVAGVFNLGFIAVSRGADDFLSWWASRLRRNCIVAIEEGLFVDQRLMDFAPGYFRHLVLRDPAYDVAYWNLHERDVTWTGQRYEVAGKPLRFFHYSGFEPLRPRELSKHQAARPRVLLEDRPGVARLCSAYATALLTAGYRDAIRIPYGFGTTASGEPLDLRTRRLYRANVLAMESGAVLELPDPFEPAQSEVFASWVRSPDATEALPPLLRARLYLEAGPELASPKKWVPYARRLLLRVLRPSNQHQGLVQETLIQAIESIEARLAEALPVPAQPGAPQNTEAPQNVGGRADAGAR